MHVSVEVAANGPIVSLQGELDLATVATVTDAMAPLTGDVTVDCRELSFMDSTGISAFIEIRQRLASDGGELRLVNVVGPVRRVLELAGVGELFGMTEASG